MIEPEDDIPANTGFGYTSRLGLIRIPRSNNQALSAINASLRILDETVAKKSDDTHLGTHSFEDITANKLVTDILEAQSIVTSIITATTQTVITANITTGNIENLIAQVANISTLSSASANIVSLSSTDITSGTITAGSLVSSISALGNTNVSSLHCAGNGDFSNITSTAADFSSATIDSLQASIATFSTVTSSAIATTNLAATTGTFDQLIVNGKSLGEPTYELGEMYPDYASPTEVPQSVITTIVPEEIQYSLVLKGGIDVTIQGTYIVGLTTNNNRYTVVNDPGTWWPALVAKTGVNFPEISGENLYELSYDSTTRKLSMVGKGDFDYTNAVDFEMSYLLLIHPKNA